MRVVLSRRQQQQQEPQQKQPQVQQQQSQHNQQNKYQQGGKEATALKTKLQTSTSRSSSPLISTAHLEPNKNIENRKTGTSSLANSIENPVISVDPDLSEVPVVNTEPIKEGLEAEISRKRKSRKLNSEDHKTEKPQKKHKDWNPPSNISTSPHKNQSRSKNNPKADCLAKAISYTSDSSRKRSSSSNLKVPHKKKVGKMGRIYNSQQLDLEKPPKNKREKSLFVINNSYDDRVELQPQFDNDPLTTTEPFGEALRKRGLEMVEQEGDGNCLFRAVSLQIYGESNMHVEVRKRCLDYMEREESHFSQFVVGEPFREYVRRKRIDGVHANNPEIQAVSELFNRPVEVYVPSNGAKPINIFHSEYKTADIPIRLSYHDGNHYNAVVNPLCPTAGLGLGLPGLEPGLADKLQMEKAFEESDQLHLKKIAKDSHETDLQRALNESRNEYQQKMIKNNTLALSDLEATDYEIEQAVLEKSLESYKNFESKKLPWSRRRHAGSPQPTASRTTLSPDYLSNTPDAHQPHLTTTVASSAISETCTSVATAAVASASLNSNFEDADSIPDHLLNTDEYPQSVQELVMNGFELSKVVKAYDLVGNNFDDMLNFLMSIGN